MDNTNLITKLINFDGEDTSTGFVSASSSRDSRIDRICGLFSEWYEGGQLNATKGLYEPRHTFIGDWDSFQNNLYYSLKALGCRKLYSAAEIRNKCMEGKCVVYTLYNSLGVNKCINIIGYIGGELYDFSVRYFNEDNVKLIYTACRNKGAYPIHIEEDRYAGIKHAYAVPIEVLELIAEQNTLMQNF